MCACFLVLLVVADVEGVLDDAADHLRREVGEMRGERCGDGVEVGALVVVDAARGDHFLEVRVVRVGRVRGDGGAGAEEDRDERARGALSAPAPRPPRTRPTRTSRK